MRTFPVPDSVPTSSGSSDQPPALSLTELPGSTAPQLSPWAGAAATAATPPLPPPLRPAPLLSSRCPGLRALPFGRVGGIEVRASGIP